MDQSLSKDEASDNLTSPRNKRSLTITIPSNKSSSAVSSQLQASAGGPLITPVIANDSGPPTGSTIFSPSLSALGNSFAMRASLRTPLSATSPDISKSSTLPYHKQKHIYNGSHGSSHGDGMFSYQERMMSSGSQPPDNSSVRFHENTTPNQSDNYSNVEETLKRKRSNSPPWLSSDTGKRNRTIPLLETGQHPKIADFPEENNFSETQDSFEAFSRLAALPSLLKLTQNTARRLQFQSETQNLHIPGYYNHYHDDLQIKNLYGILQTLEIDPNLFLPVKHKSNILESIFREKDVAMAFCAQLDGSSLIILYSISKQIHRYMNAHLAAFVRANARAHTAESAHIFRYQLYQNACCIDPTGRKPMGSITTTPNNARTVPGLAWLNLIHHREKVVTEILARLSLSGHRFPTGVKAVLKKLWLLLDISSNGVRRLVLHRQDIWSNEELMLATMFFVKLDMHFTDPIDGNGGVDMRHWVMGQKSLDGLVEALRELDENGQVSRKLACELYIRSVGQVEEFDSDEEEFGNAFDGDESSDDEDSEDTDDGESDEEDVMDSEDEGFDDESEDEGSIQDNYLTTPITPSFPSLPAAALQLYQQDHIPYLPEPAPESTVFGVPISQVGVSGQESGKQGSDPLLSPDQLVMFESIKRNLGLQRYILNFMIWGWIDMETLEDIPLPKEKDLWRELGWGEDPWAGRNVEGI